MQFNNNGRRSPQTGLLAGRNPATSTGLVYDAPEVEWLKAITRFHHEHRRYPTAREAFRLAWDLGYRLA